MSDEERRAAQGTVDARSWDTGERRPDQCLTLVRPLVVLDVETHDKVPPEQAFICQLGFIKYYHDGREPYAYKTLVKPPVPISAGATGVHSITNEQVNQEGVPTFADLATLLAAGFRSCDYSGYNGYFDLNVIDREMRRARVSWSFDDAFVIDPNRIWQVGAPRTLGGAVKEFLNREPTAAHDAFGDVLDCAALIPAMLDRFGFTPTPQALHDMCFGDRIDIDGKFKYVDGVPTCVFGKRWNGTAMRDIDRGYYKWIIESDFSPSTKKHAMNAMNGIFPPEKPKDATGSESEA